MAAGPTWLYSLVHLAGASLIAAIYVAGLVVALRRWHLGMAPRLAAIGFGLLLLSDVLQQGFTFVLPLLTANAPSSTDNLLLRIMVVSSLAVLLSATGYVLLVLALRMALRDYERARNASPVTPTAVWTSPGDGFR